MARWTVFVTSIFSIQPAFESDGEFKTSADSLVGILVMHGSKSMGGTRANFKVCILA